jgi:hypothetical protein
MIDWRTSARPPPPEGGLSNDASAQLGKDPEHVRRVEDELVAELQGNMSLEAMPDPGQLRAGRVRSGRRSLHRRL